ncbi:unnamed protein product [Urochloa decumbens]|uniref:FAR1 domain-containing protein n=1 Tax=Urochloa decumbens TaxID=240449 RepID=A0ABC9DN83_9POAL
MKQMLPLSVRSDDSSSIHGGFGSGVGNKVRIVGEVMGRAFALAMNLPAQSVASSSNNNSGQRDVSSQHGTETLRHAAVGSLSMDSTDYVHVEVGLDDEEVYFEDEGVVCSTPVIPCVGMEFDTTKEAKKVYNDYALKMGFSIRVATSKRSSGTKELIRKEWECMHARKPDSSSSAPNEELPLDSASASTNQTSSKKGSKKRSTSAIMTTATKKCNIVKKLECKAHMAVGKRDGKWRVIVMQTEHSHPLLKSIGVRKHLRSHRSISWADYELLKTLYRWKITTARIMGSVTHRLAHYMD